jgi:polyvinyl alcohol dehydrogenase (cytochrome)
VSRLLGIAAGIAMALGCAVPVSADWTTYHHDNGHSGKDPSAIPVTNAAIAWTSPNLIGDVTAEPLYFNGTVYVATMADYLYALDPNDGHVLWSDHLNNAYSSSLPCGKDWATVGIMSTPVIDPATNTLYAVGMISTGVYQLWAVDLATHGTRYAPVPITTTGFNALIQNQRGALTFYNGQVYVPFGGRDGDCGSYHGWVFRVNAADGSGLTSYHTAALGAGMWGRSGGVIAPGNLPGGFYTVATGNAVGSDACESSTFKEQSALVKLNTNMQLYQYWAPSNWASLSCGDVDIGSLGPTMVGSGLMFQGGKNGRGYLIDATNLGGIGGEKSSIQVCSGGIFGGAAYDASTNNIFVPCGGGLYEVQQVNGTQLAHGWSAGINAGAPIIIGGAVWAIDRGGSGLSVYNESTGSLLFHDGTLGAVPHGFVSPGYGVGLVFAPGDNGNPIVRAYWAGGWAASYDLSAAPTSWVVGQTKTFNVTVHNTGTQQWSGLNTPNRIRLNMHFTTKTGGARYQSYWLTSQSFDLGTLVPPGTGVVVSVTVTAPVKTGAMYLEATMFSNLQFWFPQSGSVGVTVNNHWQASFDISAAPTGWAANQTRSFAVTLTNVGDQAWTSSGANPVMLNINFSTTRGGSKDIYCCWKSSRSFGLGGDVAPGGSTTVTVTVTAPSAAGAYYLEAQLFKNQQFWFPNWTYKGVTVAAAVWSASYAMTAPASWTAGQTQSVSVTLTNTGNQTWPSGGANPVKLDLNFSTTHGGNHDITCCWKTSQTFSLGGDVAPGASVTLTVSVTAPTTARSYYLEAQLFKNQQFWFGTWTYTPVTVS